MSALVALLRPALGTCRPPVSFGLCAGKLECCWFIIEWVVGKYLHSFGLILSKQQRLRPWLDDGLPRKVVVQVKTVEKVQASD